MLWPKIFYAFLTNTVLQAVWLDGQIPGTPIDTAAVLSWPWWTKICPCQRYVAFYNGRPIDPLQ